MNQREARKGLVVAFRRLPKRDLERFAYHLERGTPIAGCKGKDGLADWTDGKGGG